MNGKFLLIFMIIANLFVLAVGYAQYQAAPTVITKSEIADKNIILSGFFNLDADSFESQSQIETGSDLSESVADFNKPQSGFTVAGTAGQSLSFIDALQLVFSFLSLLTPIPIITFFYALSLPVFPLMIIATVTTMLYIISLAEFLLRGSF